MSITLNGVKNQIHFLVFIQLMQLIQMSNSVYARLKSVVPKDSCEGGHTEVTTQTLLNSATLRKLMDLVEPWDFFIFKMGTVIFNFHS